MRILHQVSWLFLLLGLLGGGFPLLSELARHARPETCSMHAHCTCPPEACTCALPRKAEVPTFRPCGPGPHTLSGFLPLAPAILPEYPVPARHEGPRVLLPLPETFTPQRFLPSIFHPPPFRMG